MELIISGFVSAIGLSYLAELFIAPPNWGLAAYHSFVPQLAGNGSILLAVGIVGATVMPHAIYLHSSLTKDRMPVRNDEERKQVLRFSNKEVLLALSVAGLVNMAMVAMSAVAFNFTGHSSVATIETAYHTLIPLFGTGAAVIFMISLLASGLSSSVVGTMAGQGIMQDFVNFKVPLWLRRLLTMIPTFVIVAMGTNPTQALIISQVILSLILPIPMISLLLLTSRRDIMGNFLNSRFIKITAWTATIVVLSLNILLVWQIL
jgi:manganese transport protein